MDRGAGGAGESKLRKTLASVVSGSASGAVVSLALQPLDVIRTQLQAQAIASPAGATRSTVQTARDVWAKGGLRSFWRGSGPTVWRLSIGLGVQFLVLETVRDAILASRRPLRGTPGAAEPGRRLSSLEAFVTGGLARGVAAAVTVPFTIAKTRAEFGGPAAAAHKGTLAALRSIARQEGAAGIFRGLGPTVLTNAPFSGLYFMFYSGLQARLQKEGRPAAAVNVAAGTAAAVAATLLTQPADLVRTHMQLAPAAGAGGRGALATLRHVLAAGGPRVLLAGAPPRIAKRTLQSALVWTLYEELQPRLARAASGLPR